MFGARRFVGGVHRRSDASDTHDSAHGDACAHAHRRADANGAAHRDACAHSHRCADANGTAHGDACANSHRCADANGTAHGDVDARAHHQRPSAHADGHSYHHAGINADAGSNAIAGSHGSRTGGAALGARRPHLV